MINRRDFIGLATGLGAALASSPRRRQALGGLDRPHTPWSASGCATGCRSACNRSGMRPMRSRNSSWPPITTPKELWSSDTLLMEIFLLDIF